MPAAEHQPVDAEEADQFFAPLELFDTVLIAVSGGPDSLALLHLAAEWRARRAAAGLPAPRLHAATVDHQLRDSSATEAAIVAGHCDRLGVPHAIMHWSGEKPASGIAEAAREARYRLLAKYAERVATSGSSAVTTAHTADDQAETVLMRLGRGSGVVGLAAMRSIRPIAPASPIMLVRPLLSVEKARLIATLRATGLSWCEDPTNSDRSFERVRVRSALEHLRPSGLTTQALTTTARRMREAADALDYAADRFRATLGLDLHDGIYAQFSQTAFDTGPLVLRRRVLRDLITAFGGTTPEPEASEIENLTSHLEQPSPVRATLGGVVVSKGDSHIRLWREAARIASAHAVLAPGQPLIWDRRFRITIEGSPAGAVSIAPLGRDAFNTVAAHVPKRLRFPSGAAHGLPAFWAGRQLLAVPSIGVVTPDGAAKTDVQMSCERIWPSRDQS